MLAQRKPLCDQASDQDKVSVRTEACGAFRPLTGQFEPAPLGESVNIRTGRDRQSADADLGEVQHVALGESVRDSERAWRRVVVFDADAKVGYDDAI